MRWASMICDSELRLVWASDELKEFVQATPDSDLGYGLHISEALIKDTWLSGIHPESMAQVFSDLGSYLIYDLNERGRKPEDYLPAEFASLVTGLKPAEPPAVLRISIQATNPGDPDLPPYPVNVCAIRIADEAEVIGWVMIFFIGVRPNLVTLLARGDEKMYERMARLRDPGPQQAAVLFCDLHRSGMLARTMSTAAYFKLVRRLWTAIDAIVASNSGIVGKHAGDGASAFFLVDDLGSESGAAAVAIRAARRIHEISEEVFSEVLEEPCQMKLGLHWGGSLYMGQLVPGGRLDVTALGDEVNEAARIQESARPHETLASKQLVERLDPDDAAGLGLDLEKLKYEPLADRDGASSKAVEDAGAIAVTVL
jgi:class 3 adenylate cyclase